MNLRLADLGGSGAFARRWHRRHPGVVRVGVLAHNATKVSALIEDARIEPAPVAQAAAERPADRGTGLPRKRADAPAA